VLDGKLFAFKERELHVIDVTQAVEQSWRVIGSRPIGTYSQNSVCITPAGIVFANSAGLWLFGGELTNLLEDRWLTNWKSKVTSSVRVAYDEVDNMIIVSFGTESIAIDSKYRIYSITATNPTDASNLTTGVDGRVSYLYYDTADTIYLRSVGSSTSKEYTSSFTTGWFNFGNNSDKIVRGIGIRARQDTTASTSAINLYVNYDYSGTFALLASIAYTETGLINLFKKLKRRFKAIRFKVELLSVYQQSADEIYLILAQRSNAYDS
jgi:hypothetical protein